jgi:hypothetical protein
VNNEQLGELFDQYRQSASGKIQALLQEKYRDFTLADPEGRPFSHPYY